MKALIVLSVSIALLSGVGAADFSIADYGAKSDGSKCSAAFKAAFAAAEKAGGGRVVVPAGTWVSGAIHLKSNCELHLSEGAEIVFTQNPDDYLPAVHTSWEGMECWNYSPLVYAYCCTNIAITGKGTLRGYAGEFKDTLWKKWVPQDNGIRAARRQLYDWGAQDCPVEKRRIYEKPNANTRPHLLQINRCANVRLEDFKVRNSPFWTIHLYHSEDITVRGLDVFAHGNNNDGIDIEMTRNVLVENCVFDQGDDGVVIKSGRNRDAWRLNRPTENVVIRKCKIVNAHTVLGVGSEISGGVRNILMEDCTASEVHRVYYVKTNRRRGGFVDNVIMRRVKAECALDAVVAVDTDILYEWAKFPDYELKRTEISNLFVEDVSCRKAKRAIRVKGDVEMPVKGMRVHWLDVGEVENSSNIIENCHGFVEVKKHEPNYDTTKITPYTLEDPLVFTNGAKVTGHSDWQHRRREILDVFASEMYGQEPPKPQCLNTELVEEKVAGGGFAIRRRYRMTFLKDKSGPAVEWVVWTPRHSKKPSPVILKLNYRGNQEFDLDHSIPLMTAWSRNKPGLAEDNRVLESTRGFRLDQNGDSVFPLQMILARGYAVMTACYCEISPDPSHTQDGFKYRQNPFAYTGVFSLWGKRDVKRSDNITSLGAWAWALSRGLDLAERIPEIDARRNIVTGYSRLAKAALLAAARDDRFAVCVPVQTGGGGCPLAKRDFGENISTECKFFTHWYCDAYAKYAAEPWKTMPFDQHLFLAAIAPRALLVCGYNSKWFDTEGEYLALKAASPAWRLHGDEGLPNVSWPDDFDTSAIGERLGYVHRSEGHGISGCDWTWMLDFADKNFKDSPGASLFFAGDSTLDEYGRRHRPGRAPLASWGSALEGSMRLGCCVRNFAKSGASTRSFIEMGIWERLIKEVKAGDFVVVQFGHNDQKQTTEQQRKVLYAAANGLYRDNLRKFAKEVRAKGATPIFCTPIVRATFDAEGNRLVDTTWRLGESCLGSYVQAVREIGRELGVDVVDMNAMTHALCERIGRDEAYKFYAIATGIEYSRDGEPSKDVTHPIPAGAQAYSRLFLDDVRRRNLPVSKLFK